MSGFWNLRNQTMAQNIYNTAAKYPNKKIVVLTGFLHRYYLLKELNRLNKGSYM
jgi:erythromycin esterase-like protein